jgi:hypothetical protein
MKILPTILAAAALAGCATAEDMRAKPPVIAGTTQKSALALEECSASALTKLGAPNTVRGEGRVTMMWGNPNPAVTVTILDGGAQRTFEVRRAFKLNDAFRRNLQSCL